MSRDLRSGARALARDAARTDLGRRFAALADEPPDASEAARAAEVESFAQAEAERRARSEQDVGTWLDTFFGDDLTELDRRCAGAGPESLELFRDLDDDLWALLLSRQYAGYPNIAALLPDVPETGLQRMWNGNAGLDLLVESRSFYARVRSAFAAHGAVPLPQATVLDFGCGWGRLTRFFARDVAPGALHGCDPVEEILDVCRESGLPATLHRSEFVPSALPVSGIDLAYSFSVFTHISERAARACLEAIHGALNSGGILVLTIRPPSYLDLDPKLADGLEDGRAEAFKRPTYLFEPHPASADHPQYDGDEMDYGEAVVSLPYVEERWSDLFELVEARLATEDVYQVAIVMRKR